jgi:O-antigen/teichoic acid export membrane protein
LLSLHAHRSLLAISIVSLAASVCLTFILAPSLHATGAAIAFSGAELVLALSSFLLLKRAAPNLRFPLRVPVRVSVAALGGAAAAFIPSSTSLERGLVAGVIYVGLLIALRAIPRELMDAVLRRPQLAES